MFGDVVVGIPHHHFEKELDALKLEAGVWEDKDLSAEQLKVNAAVALFSPRRSERASFPNAGRIAMRGLGRERRCFP
jgi:hypothetical protein